MKIFFKFFARVLIIAAALGPHNPSQAGSTSSTEIRENDQKNPTHSPNNPNVPSQKEIAPHLTFILTPFKGRPNFEPSALKEPPANSQGNFSILPLELARRIIFGELDPNSISTAMLVCRRWRWLISERKDFFIKMWTEGNQNPHLLYFISHPTILVWVHNYLAPFYYQLTHLPINPPSQTIDPIIVEKFADIIKKSPHLHLFLSRFYVHFSPCRDYQDIALASYIIKGSHEICTILSQTVDNTTFPLSQFRSLTYDPKNYQFLQNHFIALRLLALTGDSKEPQLRLQSLRSAILISLCETYLNTLNDLALETFLAQHPSFGKQPYWTTYTDYDDALIIQLLMITRLVESNHANTLDFNLLKEFGNYISTVFPHLKYQSYSKFDCIFQYINTTQTHSFNHSEKESITSICESKSQEPTPTETEHSCTKGAHYLYRGQFKEAYQCIKVLKYVDGEILEALETQLKNPNLPKQLVKIIGKKTRKNLSSHNKNRDGIFKCENIPKYKDTLNTLLDGHPLSQWKLRRLIKSSKPKNGKASPKTPEKKLSNNNG